MVWVGSHEVVGWTTLALYTSPGLNILTLKIVWSKFFNLTIQFSFRACSVLLIFFLLSWQLSSARRPKVLRNRDLQLQFTIRLKIANMAWWWRWWRHCHKNRHGQVQSFVQWATPHRSNELIPKDGLYFELDIFYWKKTIKSKYGRVSLSEVRLMPSF